MFSLCLVKTQNLPTADVCHKPSNQIVSEEGAVDHPNKEVVRSVAKVFEIPTAMAIVLLGGLRWLKSETTLAEMGSRAEVVECFGLEL